MNTNTSYELTNLTLSVLSFFWLKKVSGMGGYLISELQHTASRGVAGSGLELNHWSSKENHLYQLNQPLLTPIF